MGYFFTQPHTVLPHLQKFSRRFLRVDLLAARYRDAKEAKGDILRNFGDFWQLRATTCEGKPGWGDQRATCSLVEKNTAVAYLDSLAPSAFVNPVGILAR